MVKYLRSKYFYKILTTEHNKSCLFSIFYRDTLKNELVFCSYTRLIKVNKTNFNYRKTLIHHGKATTALFFHLTMRLPNNGRGQSEGY